MLVSGPASHVLMGPVTIMNKLPVAASLRPADRRAFRAAARMSLVVDGGPTRPSFAELHDEELRTEILDLHLSRALRSQWVDAIVAALRSDILSARRHA